ncbi:cysteine proteinase [Xylona heveae TC161]|uniref:ubiquitinyl hydrolase 1 n=1 Tax=Xylona heveae (strain CBS 132557 / TC161) TaxID=1328760 RepID=A0A165JU77_XYLHT|nr:cysteine proteinase [Xylona heveae TC161]KZF26635.1 cysteine proteinase [Xylona heveae TC161]
MMSLRNGLSKWPTSMRLIDRLDLGFTTSASEILLYLAATLALGYHILVYFDLLPQRYFYQLLWNCLVFVTPFRLISAMDRTLASIPDENGNGSDGFSARSHAAKSEALRKIFGLEKGHLFPSIEGNRVISSVGTVWKGGSSGVPPGLGNWDNSCYQNSVIQGLASLPSLSEFLASSSTKFLGPNHGPTNFALREIIEKLNEPANCGRRFWTPAELKSMSSWQQQDAQEYFSKVLDQVDREITTVARRDLGMRGLGNITMSTAQVVEGTSRIDRQSDCSDGDIEKRQKADAKNEARSYLVPAPQRNPLEGLLAQRVGCMACGYSEGLSLVPFNCLTLPLGQGWQLDIRDCLDEYTALESIEGVECAKCTLLRRREQLEKLLQGPSVTRMDGQEDIQQLPEALRAPAAGRLLSVKEALEEADFSETTLSKKCQIPPKGRVTSTKSRQAVIARAPTCLVVHINRSIFDEYTGALRKNYAEVQFPEVLNLGPWCLGSRASKAPKQNQEELEQWRLDPRRSMLSEDSMTAYCPDGFSYDLRAVITHAGRHENGHYICYRKHPYTAGTASLAEEKGEAEDGIATERWWRLSDDQVSMVTEQNVLSQGGVFMLFYERVDDDRSSSLSDHVQPTADGTTNPDKSSPDDLTPCGSRTPLSQEAPSVPATEEFSQPHPTEENKPLRNSFLNSSPLSGPARSNSNEQSDAHDSQLSFKNGGMEQKNAQAPSIIHDLHGPEESSHTTPRIDPLSKLNAVSRPETLDSSLLATSLDRRDGDDPHPTAPQNKVPSHSKEDTDSQPNSKPASNKQYSDDRTNGGDKLKASGNSNGNRSNNDRERTRSAKTSSSSNPTNSTKPATNGIPVIAAN